LSLGFAYFCNIRPANDRLQVKAPADSHGELDLETVVGTIPGSEAFQPPNPACPLVKA
jgi:hypothetical protein